MAGRYTVFSLNGSLCAVATLRNRAPFDSSGPIHSNREHSKHSARGVDDITRAKMPDAHEAREGTQRTVRGGPARRRSEPPGRLAETPGLGGGLEQAMNAPGASELWELLEREVFRLLSDRSAPGLDARSTVLLDRAALEMLLGQGFEAFRDRLCEHLASPGAVKLLATLQELDDPRLPARIDFLSVLPPGARNLVADQIVWEWARHWHEGIEGEPFVHNGVALAPLLEYEVVSRLMQVVRPVIEAL